MAWGRVLAIPELNRDMTQVVLLDGVRTPHGTLLGGLSEVDPQALGQAVIDGLLDGGTLPGKRVDWVSLGNAIQAGIGQVPARQVTVASSLPNETPTTTVNEASGSGLRAITLAADRIRAGEASVAIAGGFESMSQAPWILPGYRSGRRHGHVTAQDAMILDALWDMSLDVHMGEIAERLVDRVGDQYDLSRERQDEYALQSHERAAAAVEEGAFEAEIVPVKTDEGTIDTDEGIRPDSTREQLAALEPSFRHDGTVTAANASSLADGAGAVVLADATAAAEAGVSPLLELVDYAVRYRDPDAFNEAVGDTVEALVAANDLSVEAIDAFWINEAFAAQSVYVQQRLGIPRDRFNPLGGAIAFGHPIGASGGMLVPSLAYQARREQFQYGIVGMSIGGGGAIMSLWRRPE